MAASAGASLGAQSGKFYSRARQSLIRYARYHAWLHASIEVKDQKLCPPPRWKQYENVKGVPPPMPDVLYGRFLLNYLGRLGWVSEGKPIPFSELESWARMAKVNLTGWEFETLHMLSVCYASELIRARRPDCPSPLDEQVQEKAKDKPQAQAQFRSIR